MKGLRRVISALFALTIACGMSACNFASKAYQPSDDKYFAFTELEDGTYSVAAAADAQLPETLSLPVSYNGKNVTAVADNGFKNAAIKKVRVPANIASLGQYAFYGAELEEIYIYSGLKSIGDSAFAYCANLAEIELPSTVLALGAGAFSYDGKLEKFTSPSSLKSIGDYCFYSSSKIAEVFISASVTEIGKGAFDKCAAEVIFKISAQNTVYTLVDGKPVKK